MFFQMVTRSSAYSPTIVEGLPVGVCRWQISHTLITPWLRNMLQKSSCRNSIILNTANVKLLAILAQNRLLPLPKLLPDLLISRLKNRTEKGLLAILAAAVPTTKIANFAIKNHPIVLGLFGLFILSFRPATIEFGHIS